MDEEKRTKILNPTGGVILFKPPLMEEKKTSPESHIS